MSLPLTLIVALLLVSSAIVIGEVAGSYKFKFLLAKFGVK